VILVVGTVVLVRFVRSTPPLEMSEIKDES